jgi:hypothetical protein
LIPFLQFVFQEMSHVDRLSAFGLSHSAHSVEIMGVDEAVQPVAVVYSVTGENADGLLTKVAVGAVLGEVRVVPSLPALHTLTDLLCD